MIALEGLKNEVTVLKSGLLNLETNISHATTDIGLNSDDNISNFSNISANTQQLIEQNYNVQHLSDKCRYNDWAINASKDALTLYCQQFAFAPEMVGACSDLLSCNARQLPFRFVFHDDEQKKPVFDD